MNQILRNISLLGCFTSLPSHISSPIAFEIRLILYILTIHNRTMNPLKYLQRQLIRLKIDLLTQRTFLAGEILSIDNDNIIKTVSTNYEELEIIFFEHFPLKEK